MKILLSRMNEPWTDSVPGPADGSIQCLVGLKATA